MRVWFNFKLVTSFLLLLAIPVILVCSSSATVVTGSGYKKNLTLIDNSTNAKTLTPKTSSDWIDASVGLPSSGDSYNVILGDINKDGYLDLIYTTGQNTNTGLCAMIGNGGTSWVNNSTGLPMEDWYTDMAIGDLNNDGNLDFVAGNYTGSGVYLGNGGAGGSMVWTGKNAPRSWNGVALGDVNKDGILDIATGYEGVWVNTSNAGAGDVFVWASNSTGLETSNSYYGVAFGDINNDGNLDLVGAIDEVGGGVRAWTGNGGAGSSMVWTNVTANLPLTGIYTGIYLVDVNCDGNLDIIVGGGHGGAGVWVWTGNGGVGGSFVWTLNSTNLPTGGDYYQVVAGDLNGDGNIDIVAANNSGGGVELWEGNGGVGGSMIWTNNSTDLPVGGCIDVCLGDVNNDGRLDIAAAFDGQGVRVLLNNKPFPNYTYDLREGWNFVTLPLNNTTIKRAGNLAKLVGSNCTTISKWDNFNKQFIVFSITTPAINNFTIEDGAGYLVYVTANTPFTISGALIKKVIHNLYIGWNNIGWFNFTSTYSGDLAQNITNCTAIAYWNTTLGRFVIHPKGTGISDVFTIKRGCGYFVYVTSDVTWVNKG